MPPLVPVSFDAVNALAEGDICNLALSRIGSELIRDTDEQTLQARVCRNIYAQTRNELLRMIPWNFAKKSAAIAEDSTYPYERDNFTYAFDLQDRTTFSGTNDTSVTFTAVTPAPTEDMVGRFAVGTNIPSGARVSAVTSSTITLDRATTGVSSGIVLYLPALKVLSVASDPSILYKRIGSFSASRILCNVYTATDTFGVRRLDVQFIEEVTDPAAFDPMFRDALVLRIAAKAAPALAKQPTITNMLLSEFAQVMRMAANSSSEEMVVDEGDEWWTKHGRP